MAGKPLALQLCSYSDYLTAGLSALVDPVRWFELDAAAQGHFLASRAGEVRVVATGGHLGCPSDLMRALPALELVAINGVGFDKVDLGVAEACGVMVSNTPDVLNEDVADLAVGMVIGLMRQLPQCDAFVRSGNWLNGEIGLSRKVSGSRFGIVGLGRIGREIAARLAAFGPVAYSGRTRVEVGLPYFAEVSALAEWADVLIIACASTPETAGMIDAHVLAALGERGYLVNIARGAVVDEAALAQVIAEKRIAGAALDVFAHEPQVPAELIASDRTMLAPHIASATHETRTAMADLVLANIEACLAGKVLVTPVPGTQARQ